MKRTKPEKPFVPPPRRGLTEATTPTVDPKTGKEIPFKDAKSLGEVMPSVIQLIEQWRERCRAFQERVETHIKTVNVPSVIPCPVGGDSYHALDVEASVRASWAKQPEMEFVYSLCPDCAGRAVTEDDLRLHRMGAGKIFLKATFDNWTPRLASDGGVLNRCRQFAARPSGFLTLQGSIGLGKTHLCVAIMRETRGGRLMTQNHFLMMLRETYRNDGAPDPIEMCKRTRILFLDELGVSSGGRDEFPALYEVLNHRYADGMPTVITTNVEPADFASVFGDRIADRLVTGTICQLKGDSWRRSQ